jgi:hypothetical protein
MAGVPLSEETKRRVEILFDGGDAAVATELLTNECGSNLPRYKNFHPLELERIRIAALKVSAGRLDRLRQEIELAKQDWRDVLLHAGFINDVEAHMKWMPQKPKH